MGCGTLQAQMSLLPLYSLGASVGPSSISAETQETSLKAISLTGVSSVWKAVDEKVEVLCTLCRNKIVSERNIVSNQGFSFTRDLSSFKYPLQLDQTIAWSTSN